MGPVDDLSRDQILVWNQILAPVAGDDADIARAQFLDPAEGVAKADDIAQLLNNYNASIVSGPKSGMFRVRFGDKALSKDDAAKLMTRLQGEKIISLVVSAD